MEQKEAPDLAKTMMFPDDGGDEGKIEKESSINFGSVEAQWILTCLDDAYNKLSLSSFLTPKILQDGIIAAVDHEMVVALKEHFEVEKQYTNKMTKFQRGELEGDIDEQNALRELDICLSDSTRTVARLLKMNPLLVRRLREVCSKRSPSALGFINTFARLKKLILNKLKMSAEEEQAMREQLEKLQEEEKDDTNRFLEMTKLLAEERNDHKDTLAQKDKKILRLRKQIEQKTLETEKERKDRIERMSAEAAADKEAFENDQIQLEKDLAKTKTMLDKDGAEHWTAELKMHRQKFNRAKEVEELIAQYDRDMTTQWTAYTELKDVYKDEGEELDVLQDYFRDVDAEIKRQEEEIRDLTAARDEELYQQRKIHQAAVIIQKLFRASHIKAAAAAAKAKKAAASKAKEK